jgi:hypothetical protein
MEHQNAELIARLYGAFDRRDGDAMAACYAPDARFNDPVFGDLSGTEGFWQWSRQALGTPGLVLGWTPLLRRKVGSQARAGLDAFIAGS